MIVDDAVRAYLGYDAKTDTHDHLDGIAKYRAEVRCPVGLDVWEALRKMANARGLSVGKLAQLLIEVAVDERLVGKIIDDCRPRSRKRRPDSAPRIGRPRRDASRELPPEPGA